MSWRNLLVATITLATFSAQPARACSVCQCGDYTLNLMGTEKAYPGRIRIGLDTTYRRESMGVPGDDERITHERRTALGISYAFSDRLTLAARLPYVDKQYRDPDLTGAGGKGLGDVDLSARYVLSNTAVPARQVYGVIAGLRLPTSQRIKQDGEPVDIDGQPGVRATVPSVGGFYGWFKFPALVYVSAQITPEARGQQGFRQGNTAVATITGQYALNQKLSLQLSLENRYTGKNIDGGVLDPDSGGFVAYVVPGIAYRISNELIANAAVQIRAVHHFNGTQTENGEIRAGLTYDLPNFFSRAASSH